MWEIILSVPILFATAFVQIGVFGQIHLFQGSTDLLMLVIIAWALHPLPRYAWIWVLLAGLIMSYLSAMPMNGYLIIYIAIWLMIRFLRKRVWQMPVILMLLMTMVGSLLETFFTLGALKISGGVIDFHLTVNEIIIPSLTMNLILAIPVYGFVSDLANTIYYDEVVE